MDSHPGYIVASLLLLVIYEGQTCEQWEFSCANKECIRYIGRCDGRPTCSDGSDEQMCPTAPATTPGTPAFHRSCYDGSFQCTNGRCIYRHWRCDGQDDCGDLSDETHCGGDGEPSSGNKLLLNTESIIGISIALVALVLLVAGIMIFLMYYRRKFVRSSAQLRQQDHVPEPDMLDHMPGMLYNIPREALLREPPPQYTSQQDLSSAHVNPGYQDDEIRERPPPCYSSNPDMRLPMTHILEPPPCYSTHQSFSVIETNLNESNTTTRNQVSDISSDSIVQPIEIIERCSTERKLETPDKGVHTSSTDTEWRGVKCKATNGSLRKQKGYSMSDSNLVRASGRGMDADKQSLCSSNAPTEMSNAQRGSMTDSRINTVSAFVEESKTPTVHRWIDNTLPRTNDTLTVSQPVPNRMSLSCSRIPDVCGELKPVTMISNVADTQPMVHVSRNTPPADTQRRRSSAPRRLSYEKSGDRKMSGDPATSKPASSLANNQNHGMSNVRTSHSTQSLNIACTPPYPEELRPPSHIAGAALDSNEQLGRELDAFHTSPTAAHLNRLTSQSLPSLSLPSERSVSLGADTRGFEC